MKRAATPFFRTVVPAITQVPASFGDVALQAKSALQQTWEERYGDHQVISSGSLYDTTIPTTTTTTTTTTTSSSSQLDFSHIHDSTAIVQRVDDVFDNLSVDRTHPTSAALEQVVRETARDPQIVQRITGLDSFRQFVSTIPPNLPAIHALGSRQPTFSTFGTQTDESDFLLDSLERITEQIAPDFGILPPAPTFSAPNPTNYSAPSPIPATSSTSVSSTASVSSESVSSTNASSFSASVASDPESTFTEGHAGVPGKMTSNVETAMKVVIPLTILAVAAAAVTKLSLRGATELLQAGFKVVLRFLVKQPSL